MYIVLIVKIWNVLDVNRLGDYICVCLTHAAPTELETVGNDSCSIPEEEEEEEEEEMYIMNLHYDSMLHKLKECPGQHSMDR
jgi:hypothetical protein